MLPSRTFVRTERGRSGATGFLKVAFSEPPSCSHLVRCTVGIKSAICLTLASPQHTPVERLHQVNDERRELKIDMVYRKARKTTTSVHLSTHPSSST
ncbi:hypothetical protein GN956_G17755 [Arapaima gigas]